MADWAHAFLSKVILEEEMGAAVNARITTEFFRNDEHKRIYQFMLDHFGRHGTAPDEHVVAQAFPTSRWKPQKQALSYLIERMQQDRSFVILTQGLSSAADYVQTEQPAEIQQVLQEALIQSRLETSNSLDFDFASARLGFEELLVERMDNPGMLRGISTGFNGIDYVTGGLQPEQYIVLLGTPKTFKSATLLAMAKAVHEQAKVACFIGYEMSNVEQTDRMVSLYSGVSLTKIMNGTLTEKEFKTVQKALRRVEGMRPFIFSTDITAATTVSGVQAKIQQYQPDVVFVDGAYLMQSEQAGVDQGSPQAMTSISRGMKRLAQAQKIPIVVTTQASLTRSKSGLSISSAMYTQAWGQDCDIMLGVERVREDKEQTELVDEINAGPAVVKFRVVESRSGPRRDTLLEWDWSAGSVTEIDVAKARQQLSVGSRRRWAYQDDGDDD